MIVELIDDFLAEYPATPSGSDEVDTEEADEVIEAIAKTMAELTSHQDGIFRQHLVERLTRDYEVRRRVSSRRRSGFGRLYRATLISPFTSHRPAASRYYLSWKPSVVQFDPRYAA
jgi:hypothetical protein